MKTICTDIYGINLKERTDRKEHILSQFKGRYEFKLHLIEGFKNKNGSIGLGKTIKHILKDLAVNENDFIIICEDDHQFTNKYSKQELYSCIAEAKEKDADILLGGISWFNNIVQTSKRLFWVEKFSGTQFLIIFRKFFQVILNASFTAEDSLDYKLCSLTNKKSLFLMKPPMPWMPITKKKL